MVNYLFILLCLVYSRHRHQSLVSFDLHTSRGNEYQYWIRVQLSAGAFMNMVNAVQLYIVRDHKVVEIQISP